MFRLENFAQCVQNLRMKFVNREGPSYLPHRTRFVLLALRKGRRRVASRKEFNWLSRSESHPKLKLAGSFRVGISFCRHQSLVVYSSD